MKLSIRLQNHGCRNHPLWWIVVAPNRKNIKGRYTQHVGYWYLRMTEKVKRGAIFNLVRIKYWIGCGAVPTNRVQRLLNQFGIMPKPWYYVKSEEELEKLKPNEQQLDDKKKRKIEAKALKKQREEEGYLSVFNQYVLSRRPLPNKRNWQRLYATVNQTIINQQRENEMLRAIMMQSEYKKYQQMRQLSGDLDAQQESLDQLQKKLKALQQDLAYLEKNTINLHPVKKSMIMEKINELVPKIYELKTKQEQELEENTEATMEETVSKRRALHEVMVKRITSITKQIQFYYKMLEPLTRESYLEYLVNKVGINYNEAVKEVDQDFELYENEGIAPTKGELFRNYNVSPFDEGEIENQQINPDVMNHIFAEQEPVQQEAVEEGEAQQGQEGQQAPVQGEQAAEQAEVAEDEPVEGGIQQQQLNRQPSDQLSPEQIAILMQHQSRPQDPRFNYVQEQDLNAADYNLLDAQSVAKMVKDGKLILPTTKHVHPFPDLKSYIPEEYYEVADRWSDFIKSVPAYYPEDQLLRYREKMRNRKQNIQQQVKERREESSV